MYTQDPITALYWRLLADNDATHLSDEQLSAATRSRDLSTAFHARMEADARGLQHSGLKLQPLDTGQWHRSR